MSVATSVTVPRGEGRSDTYWLSSESSTRSEAPSPGAAMGVAETERVEELIRRMRDRGRAILLVGDEVVAMITGLRS